MKGKVCFGEITSHEMENTFSSNRDNTYIQIY